MEKLEDVNAALDLLIPMLYCLVLAFFFSNQLPYSNIKQKPLT